MKKIIVATNNQGKLKEIKEILNNYELLSLKEAEGSNVRNMVEWLLTSEGQKAMSNAGYVPVKATK